MYAVKSFSFITFEQAKQFATDLAFIKREKVEVSTYHANKSKQQVVYVALPVGTKR